MARFTKTCGCGGSIEVVYGQRTADDRLVFGGRGAPYHLGSRIRPEYDRDEAVFARLYATLVDLFPVLAGTRVTHAWGGALGIPRDWCASVGLDRETGLAWAGGYVGDGVSTTIRAKLTMTPIPGTKNYRLSVHVKRVSNAGEAGFEEDQKMLGMWSSQFNPLLRKIVTQASGMGGNGVL